MQPNCLVDEHFDYIGISYPGKSKLVEMSGSTVAPYFTGIWCWVPGDYSNGIPDDHE